MEFMEFIGFPEFMEFMEFMEFIGFPEFTEFMEFMERENHCRGLAKGGSTGDPLQRRYGQSRRASRRREPRGWCPDSPPPPSACARCPPPWGCTLCSSASPLNATGPRTPSPSPPAPFADCAPVSPVGPPDLRPSCLRQSAASSARGPSNWTKSGECYAMKRGGETNRQCDFHPRLMHSGQQKYDKRSFPNCKQVKHWHFISAAAFSREYMLIQFSELHK